MKCINLEIEIEDEAINRIERGEGDVSKYAVIYVKNNYETPKQMYADRRCDIQKAIIALDPDYETKYEPLTEEHIVYMAPTVVLPLEVVAKGGTFGFGEVMRYAHMRLMVTLSLSSLNKNNKRKRKRLLN